MIKDFFAGLSAGALAIVICIGLALLAVILWAFGFGFFLDHGGADRIGENQKKLAVEGNGQYRIGAYDSFYDQCATVQTDKQMLKNTQTELRLTGRKDPSRRLQLLTNLTAQRNKLAADVNQYNVDARKSYTKAQFRASDLPAVLYVQGDTTCTT